MARLTAEERKAFDLLCSGMSQTKAFATIRPNIKKSSAKSHATDFFKSLYKKLSDKQLLEVEGVGKSFCINKLKELTKSQSPVIFAGQITDHYSDNQTQFKATELLAKLNGMTDKPEDSDDDGTADGIKIIIDGDVNADAAN